MSGISDIQQKLANIGIEEKIEPKKDQNDLGQEEFLELLVAQLRNQDPMKPMENGDFMGQIAQFGTVDGVHNLEKAFSNFSESILSSQALQATSLVGRGVNVPGNTNLLRAGEKVHGQLPLDEYTAGVNVKVYNESGELVKSLDLGDQPSGTFKFSWDGTNNAGQGQPPGVYYFEATGRKNGATTESLPMHMTVNVDSVTLGKGNGGLLLNLSGMGTVDFDQIVSIN